MSFRGQCGRPKENRGDNGQSATESSQSTANVQPRVDHGKGKDKLKDNEKGMNEKEKDDEVRESVFEDILIDKEEFFLPKSPPIKPNKPTKTLPYPSRIEVLPAFAIFTRYDLSRIANCLSVFPKEWLEDVLEVVKCDSLTNGDPITPFSTIPTKEDLTNEKVEKHEVKTCNLSKEISIFCTSIKKDLILEKQEVLEKNEILKRNNTCDFQIPSSSLGKKEVEGEKNLDVKTIVSFFAPIGNCVRKWATNEFVKDNDEINHEVFKSNNENDLGVHDNEEEEIAFLDGLLENENFFEMNDKKVESLERKTKEDFETKDEPKSKKELQVVHPDIEILNHFETTSYVGSDYVFYEDFNLVDMFSGFWRIHGSKLWKNKAMPTISIDGLQSSLHKVWICQISQEISQKRTRERMSDQEAKEIKTEAREIMPQPSSVNCNFHSQLTKPAPLFVTTRTVFAIGETCYIT
ncbi:hypothetical protein Tco_0653876 [Tanacetum coccineum]|uniref:Uncharacterized protein n=1 Tax=Tanacetum coccineum TaxID=301880 RepID=A0ABQ4X1U9_9ASTR